MNASKPRVVPVMAETGDSFSSPCRRSAARPKRKPTSIAARTASVTKAKSNRVGMRSMLASDVLPDEVDGVEVRAPARGGAGAVRELERLPLSDRLREGQAQAGVVLLVV